MSLLNTRWKIIDVGRVIQMKKKIVSCILLASLSLSLFSCGSKKTPEVKIVDSPIHRLEVGDASRLTFDGLSKVGGGTINNGTGETDSTGKVLSYGNNGSEINLCELTLLNHDDTKYYEVIGDDVIYNGVMYVGLNKVLSDITCPYDKRDMINFIVKSLTPSHYAMIAIVYSDHDENMTAMPIDQVLENEWDNYTVIKNKYGGQKVWWQIDLYNPITQDKSASLYGGDKYVLYRGDRGELKVDLAKVAYKKPEITDIPKYIQEILDGYKDYDGTIIMSETAGLTQEEFHKFFDIDQTEEEWINSGVLG